MATRIVKSPTRRNRSGRGGKMTGRDMTDREFANFIMSHPVPKRPRISQGQ